MNAVNLTLLLLVSLTHVSLANNFNFPRLLLRQRSQRTRGHGGFYDENQYDDGYAEYTGAEKRTFSKMQRRRFQDVEEDEPQEKRESIEELLLRELTRGEYAHKETNDVEYPDDTPSNERKFLDFDDVRGEDFDWLPEKRTKSDELKEQTLDGVGTASDDLALKREEKKQQIKDEKNKFDNLPADGELFEGDIIMDQRLRSWVTGQYDKRDAIRDTSYLWPASLDENGERVIRVPYTLSDEIKRDEEKMDSIRRAVESYDRYTCIRYVPAKEDDENGDYAHFLINSTMCYSSVGRQGGKQDISIGNGCERVGTVLHEMLHTLGFIHEQSRPDRDKYVRVFYENIRSGLEHNFEKYTTGEVKTPESMKKFYDFDSCLHYNNQAFSKNDDDTLQSIQNPRRRFGQRKSFSTHDILQVNELYNCKVSNLREKMQDIPYN